MAFKKKVAYNKTSRSKTKLDEIDSKMNHGIIKMNKIHSYRLNKIQNFLDLGLINRQCILAGGSLRTLLDPQDEVKDYDIFPLGSNTQKDTIINHLYDVMKAKGAKVIHHCTELQSYQLNDMKIQLINIYNEPYNCPEDVLNKFDIDASRIAYDGQTLYISQLAVKNILQKYISLHKIRFAVATFKRISKFANKGYFTTDAIKDFIRQIRDPNTPIDLDTVYLD